ncbi:hypothetical protein IJ732_04820, partial [bacterium]|nr:hypothetical protein [bacterium]
NKELVSHYLKMNNILSNALKNTEATEQTKFYKLSETDFKSKFESHLKTTGCNTENPNFTPDVCLTDGSQFAYGTFDESCTDNICNTLTIDTNGKKGPNTAGKDRFTMNLTPNGVKALGESDTCSTGLDCGAYILANHKLFDGTIIEKNIAERNQEALAACKTANATSCTLANGLQLTKEGNLWTSPTLQGGTGAWEPDSNSVYPVASTNQCYNPESGEWENSSNGYCYGNDYWGGAKKYCEAQGLNLPTKTQLQNIRSIRGCDGSSTSIQCTGWFWSSELSSEQGDAYYVLFSDGSEHVNVRSNPAESSRVVCVSN